MSDLVQKNQREKSASPRVRRVGLASLLALLLVLAQTGLLLHELEHRSTAPDAYCAMCLSAQHFGDVPISAPPSLSYPPLSLRPVGESARFSPTVLVHAFAARAPPCRS